MRTASFDVVITGLGAVCSLGRNCTDLWRAIEAGEEGISTIRRFSSEGFRVRTGALVSGFDDPEGDGAVDGDTLCRRFAAEAAREALLDARVDPTTPGPGRIGFVMGTGLVGSGHPIDLLARGLAAELGLLGPCLVVSTACSSSTGAIGLGRDLLALDAADIVVCGGSDVLTPEVFAGFHALGVLNPARCAPFSLPFGTTLGEGAGFVVLERGEAARARGVPVHAVLAGSGLSGDAFHETSPDPTGSGVERALRGALRDADLGPVDIDYVNAHGSGTEANDPAEWRGIQRGLGPRSVVIPLSSTKGALGHAQGAAGALEAIVTILAMEHGVVPPTLHFAGPRPFAPADPVGQARPRPWPCRHVLSLNAAFGGANAAIVLSTPEAAAAAPRGCRARARRPVAVRGIGMVGPYGLGAAAFQEYRATGNGKPRAAGQVPPFRLESLVPTADPRGLDPMSRHLTAAAALALREAALTPRGALRDRIGLLVGAVRPSPESHAAFDRSIRERGLHGISAAAFARVVLNAPSGFCSKLLGLRGPLSTLASGGGGGLVVIALAAEILGRRDDADWMVAAGVEEAEPITEATAHPTDPGGLAGAVAALLGPPGGPGPDIRLAGWGLAGSDELEAAIDRALAAVDASGAGASRRVPTGSRWTFREEEWAAGAGGPAQATASATAFAAAVLALRAGECDEAMVTSDPDGATVVAMLLRREEVA